MEKSMNARIAAYAKQLADSDIRATYEFLIKYVMRLKAAFETEYAKLYTCGNVSPGYMDFTYFSFFDAYLRENKLRFGIVLKHRELRFELWLMGQNAAMQAKYWQLLKTTKWNENRDTMPKYSVLEAVLVDDPDFDDPDALAATVIGNAQALAEDITRHLKDIV